MKGGGRVGQQEKELKETPQSGERKVFFLCNGNKAGCIKEFCFENGGVCLYTSDVMYAANFREGIGEGQYYEELKETPKEGEDTIDKIGLLFESMERNIDMIGKMVNGMQNKWEPDAEKIEALERMAGIFIKERFRLDRNAMKACRDIYGVLHHINFVLWRIWKILDAMEAGRQPEPSAGSDVTGRA